MSSIPDHPLKVLVIGNGGREHALCWKLAQSPSIKQIFCAPGNGGTAIEHKTENVNLDSHDFKRLTEFCQNENIDFTVVGPENILAEGIVDYFEDHELRVFGPTQKAAQLESSKSFAKEFMSKHQLPTAKFRICKNYDSAKKIIDTEPWAQVIKADGLASGKGVYVCNNIEESGQAIKEIFQDKKFGLSGETVVLEEKLNGEEISLFLLCDGQTFLPLTTSQDNKRRFDNDQGPNTGGMGVVSPPSIYIEHEELVKKTIIEPLQAALKEEGINYQGLLYVGLLFDRDKQTGSITPKILEFNCRFGDPETQVVLPRLESDLLPALWACTDGSLNEIELEWTTKAGCCVVAVHKNYPATNSNGEDIKINTPLANNKGITVFHAGTKLVDNNLVTAGGRILAITALANDLQSAAKTIYDYLPNISFKDMDYRHDIAKTKSKIISRK